MFSINLNMRGTKFESSVSVTLESIETNQTISAYAAHAQSGSGDVMKTELITGPDGTETIEPCGAIRRDVGGQTGKTVTFTLTVRDNSATHVDVV